MNQQSLLAFVDSDVIISSLLSDQGAAYALLHQLSQPSLLISNFSERELAIVIARLNIASEKLDSLISNHFRTVTLNQNLATIKQRYAEFVTDINDAHVVAGAHLTHSRFLISYNLKDYQIGNIRAELNVVVLTPAMFLQYLRNQKEI